MPTKKEEKEKSVLQKKFGAHLRKLRKSKNLSAAELARRCGMTRHVIARLEAGKANPSLFIIYRLARGMKIRINLLL